MSSTEQEQLHAIDGVVEEEESYAIPIASLPIFADSNLGKVTDRIGKTLKKVNKAPDNEERVKLFSELLTYLIINIDTLRMVPFIHKIVNEHCTVLKKYNPEKKEFQEQCDAFLAL